MAVSCIFPQMFRYDVYCTLYFLYFDYIVMYYITFFVKKQYEFVTLFTLYVIYVIFTLF